MKKNLMIIYTAMNYDEKESIQIMRRLMSKDPDFWINQNVGAYHNYTPIRHHIPPAIPLKRSPPPPSHPWDDLDIKPGDTIFNKTEDSRMRTSGFDASGELHTGGVELSADPTSPNFSPYADGSQIKPHAVGHLISFDRDTGQVMIDYGNDVVRSENLQWIGVEKTPDGFNNTPYGIDNRDVQFNESLNHAYELAGGPDGASTNPYMNWEKGSFTGNVVMNVHDDEWYPTYEIARSGDNPTHADPGWYRLDTSTSIKRPLAPGVHDLNNLDPTNLSATNPNFILPQVDGKDIDTNLNYYNVSGDAFTKSGDEISWNEGTGQYELGGLSLDQIKQQPPAPFTGNDYVQVRSALNNDYKDTSLFIEHPGGIGHFEVTDMKWVDRKWRMFIRPSGPDDHVHDIAIPFKKGDDGGYDASQFETYNFDESDVSGIQDLFIEQLKIGNIFGAGHAGEYWGDDWEDEIVAKESLTHDQEQPLYTIEGAFSRSDWMNYLHTFYKDKAIGVELPDFKGILDDTTRIRNEDGHVGEETIVRVAHFDKTLEGTLVQTRNAITGEERNVSLADFARLPGKNSTDHISNFYVGSRVASHTNGMIDKDAIETVTAINTETGTITIQIQHPRSDKKIMGATLSSVSTEEYSIHDVWNNGQLKILSKAQADEIADKEVADRAWHEVQGMEEKDETQYFKWSTWARNLTNDQMKVELDNIGQFEKYQGSAYPAEIYNDYIIEHPDDYEAIVHYAKTEGGLPNFAVEEDTSTETHQITLSNGINVDLNFIPGHLTDDREHERNYTLPDSAHMEEDARAYWDNRGPAKAAMPLPDITDEIKNEASEGFDIRKSMMKYKEYDEYNRSAPNVAYIQNELQLIRGLPGNSEITAEEAFKIYVNENPVETSVSIGVDGRTMAGAKPESSMAISTITETPEFHASEMGGRGGAM